jgi:glycosyltransferase involved in cell wall biosynthesis
MRGESESRPLPFIFINSHPVQYFAPLYRYLSLSGFRIACWYCSDENVHGHLDRQFGANVQWDIPLLEGYKARFFRNRSWKPSLYNGFFGLINPGMLTALMREKKSVVVVHGWAYFSYVATLITARLAGHIVCLRGENPLGQELVKSKLNRLIKRLLLRGFLFPFVSRFLYIGKENKAFYNHFGVSDRRLVFTPYAVDNDRFRKAAKTFAGRREELRAELGLPASGNMILFTAKYIAKKRPLDLLHAYLKLAQNDVFLVMVGDGELKKDMIAFVEGHKLKKVYLTGFVNQQDIVKYYAAADVFVLCSGPGETWGLSVNEAMNFNLPVVVSAISGCAADLVLEGSTGFTSVAGDVESLAAAIAKAIDMKEVRSVGHIDNYSFARIADGLEREVCVAE